MVKSLLKKVRKEDPQMWFPGLSPGASYGPKKHSARRSEYRQMLELAALGRSIAKNLRRLPFSEYRYGMAGLEIFYDHPCFSLQKGW